MQSCSSNTNSTQIFGCIVLFWQNWPFSHVRSLQVNCSNLILSLVLSDSVVYCGDVVICSVHGDWYSERIGHHRCLLSSGRHDDRQVLRAVLGDVDDRRESTTSSVERRRRPAAECRPHRCHGDDFIISWTSSTSCRWVSTSSLPRWTSSARHTGRPSPSYLSLTAVSSN